jgi:hypothetical protein
MATFTALYDSCVLYPAPLRDLLMHLALTDLFRARWSDAIHEEWIRSVLHSRPDLDRRQLERTRDLMNAHVRDCLVAGYESLIPAITLPDAGDRHVLAAALHARADVIVTYNLKHFPSATLERHGIEAQHPDHFVLHLLDLAPDAVCTAVRRQRSLLKSPPKTAEELLETLEQQRLPRSVAAMRPFIDRL